MQRLARAAPRAAAAAVAAAWRDAVIASCRRAQHAAAAVADAPPALRDGTLLRTQAFVGGEWTSGAADAPRIDVHNPGACRVHGCARGGAVCCSLFAGADADSQHDPCLRLRCRVRLAAAATGARVGSVPSLGAAATSSALDAAAAAQPSWGASHPRVRSSILRTWHDLLLANADDLSLLLTSEQGKPLAEARAEITSAADYLLWFSEEAPRAYGEVIPSPTPNHRGFTTRQPLGVAAAITPWNFPTSMLARKAGAALAAGCTLVAKPSELTPLSALAFAALGERAGVPRGVLSVVTGGAAEIGGAMTAHGATRKLSFTGSTRVGKLLQAACAPRLIRTSMEARAWRCALHVRAACAAEFPLTHARVLSFFCCPTAGRQRAVHRACRRGRGRGGCGRGGVQVPQRGPGTHARTRTCKRRGVRAGMQARTAHACA
jgi:hypothetical protein